jgi:hypothetical protein
MLGLGGDDSIDNSLAGAIAVFKNSTLSIVIDDTEHTSRKLQRVVCDT